MPAHHRVKSPLTISEMRSMVLGKKKAAEAKARDKVLRPVLKELAHLSSRVVAEEIERRGLGKLSYKTVTRARARLGLKGAAA